MSRPLRREAARFAIVGLAAYGTDLLVFNALLLTARWPSVPAKVAAGLVAVAVAFVGSRWWTWRGRGGPHVVREYAAFLLVSVAAAAIQVGCLVVSREALGLRSALADNLSANVVGMALATAFRFWAFRTVVFPERPGRPVGRPVTGGAAGRAGPARDGPRS
jgi:putative flippase GtrA